MKNTVLGLMLAAAARVGAGVSRAEVSDGWEGSESDRIFMSISDAISQRLGIPAEPTLTSVEFRYSAPDGGGVGVSLFSLFFEPDPNSNPPIASFAQFYDGGRCDWAALSDEAAQIAALSVPAEELRCWAVSPQR